MSLRENNVPQFRALLAGSKDLINEDSHFVLKFNGLDVISLSKCPEFYLIGINSVEWGECQIKNDGQVTTTKISPVSLILMLKVPGN